MAVLSVFCSVCQHSSSSPGLLEAAPALLAATLARALPDQTSLYPDNNVRYMALQALAGLAAVSIQAVVREAAQVKSMLDVCLMDQDPSVVLHAFRFIKSFAKHLTSLVETEQESGLEEDESKNTNLAVNFWIDFLKPGNLELLDKHPTANIRSAFCDCLAELGGFLFSELPQSKRLLVITFILSQCGEVAGEPGPPPPLERQIQDRAALSSSLRTLGIIIMFPAHLTDTGVHIDCADAILPHLGPVAAGPGRAGGLDPSNKAVRVSASWALANLTDTLVQADTRAEEQFPISIARRILDTAVWAAADPASAVNTQSNAVRTVGNMLHWLTRERLDGEAEFERVMAAGTAAMVAAIHTGKIMKIRWNACYAASNVLRKPGLEQNYAWKRELLACLLDTVTNHQNFKVSE